MPCATLLLCAQNRAHGKDPLCYVLAVKHTAEMWPTTNTYFAVRRTETHTAKHGHTAKSVACRVSYRYAHGKAGSHSNAAEDREGASGASHRALYAEKQQKYEFRCHWILIEQVIFMIERVK